MLPPALRKRSYCACAAWRYLSGGGGASVPPGVTVTQPSSVGTIAGVAAGLTDPCPGEIVSPPSSSLGIVVLPVASDHAPRPARLGLHLAFRLAGPAGLALFEILVSDRPRVAEAVVQAALGVAAPHCLVLNHLRTVARHREVLRIERRNLSHADDSAALVAQH